MDWEKFWINTGIALVSLLVVWTVFWAACLNHVQVNEIGVAYDSMDGKVMLQSEPGWYMTTPLVKEVSLTTAPMTVHIPSEAKVINTKIVRLRGEGIKDFIRLQGFSYNLGSQLENIMLGYAFSGKQYSFMEVIQEGGPETTEK